MQAAMCELLWNCNSREQTLALVAAMPPAYRLEAESVLALITAHAFDEYQEVSDYVKDLISSL